MATSWGSDHMSEGELGAISGLKLRREWEEQQQQEGEEEEEPKNQVT